MRDHRRSEEDIDAEIQSHLDHEQDEIAGRGLSQNDALTAARREFGNPALIREQLYEERHWTPWLWFSQDVRYACRSLRANPRFFLTAVMTLALGLGANSAIFSLVDAVLFRPLPVPNPEQLASIHRFDRKNSKYISSSWPEYEYLVQNSKSFQNISAYVRFPLRLTVGDRVHRVHVEAVTPNYFEMLQLAPAMGRVFRQEDDDAAKAAPVAMIAEDLWRTRFQSDPSILNRSITLQDHTFKVIGIIPAKYGGVSINWGEQPEIWITLGAAPIVLPALAQTDILHQRGARWLLLHGRLQPGTPVQRADAELRTLAARLEQEWPEAKDVGFTAMEGGRANFWPGHRELITNTLSVFSVAAALILLLACTNVSSLLLERMLARQREVAIRLSIGASRARLIRQLLTENLVLAAPSALVALGVAFALQRVLLQFPNVVGAGLTLQLGIDSRMFVFCVASSLLSILLFGLTPALKSTRLDLMSTLRTGSGGVSATQATTRNVLAVTQVALSMMLLVAGGLFLRTLWKAYSANPGFDTNRTLIVTFDLPPEEYQSERGQTEVESLRQQAADVPGVQSATVAANIPLSAGHQLTQLRIAGAFAADGVRAHSNVVGPQYLHTLGIQLIAGRDFTVNDNAAAERVVIVNQTLAKTLWPRANAIGQAITIERGPGRGSTFEVIGVAKDIPYETVWDKAEPYLYFSSTQAQTPTGHILLRTNLPPTTLVGPIGQALASQPTRAAVMEVIPGETLVDLVLMPQRVASGLIGSFAVLAVILASVGLFGLVSYSVRQRTREISIRVALGATPGRTLWEVLRRSTAVALSGIFLGAIGASICARMLTAQIHDVSVYDAATYTVVAALLATVMLLSSIPPAVRAARIHPAIGLKSE